MNNSRQLFKDACLGKAKRPPFWMMRQAGRYLPEYRELKAKHGFLGIVKTPEAATEAAMQPMRRFDFDCAIVFSDILAVSEALGFPYDFKDGGGIILRRSVKSEADIKSIDASADSIRNKLSYVCESIKLLRKELPNKAILGFCGAPFTLAAYMVEGESAPNFPNYQKFFKTETRLFEMLMEKLSEALAEFAKMQIESDIDAFQIFDSHANLTEIGEYEKYSGKWISNIVGQSDSNVRSILFAKGMSERFAELLPTNADIFSLDSSKKLSEIYKKHKGEYSLQGNLDQNVLVGDTPELVAKKTMEIIEDMRPHGHHIFNLGHGITPDAKIENVEAMCQTVKNS